MGYGAWTFAGEGDAVRGAPSGNGGLMGCLSPGGPTLPPPIFASVTLWPRGGGANRGIRGPRGQERQRRGPTRGRRPGANDPSGFPPLCITGLPGGSTCSEEASACACACAPAGPP